MKYPLAPGTREEVSRTSSGSVKHFLARDAQFPGFCQIFRSLFLKEGL